MGLELTVNVLAMSTSEVLKQGFLVKKVSPPSYEGEKLGFNFSAMAMFPTGRTTVAERREVLQQNGLFTVLSRLDDQQMYSLLQ